MESKLKKEERLKDMKKLEGSNRGTVKPKNWYTLRIVK